MSGYNLTVEQIENVVIDAGVVYVDYGEATERMLAPCRGGNTFVVEQEIKIFERDGARGKEKGSRRIISENATLTVRLMNLSQENLKLALPGANFVVGVITNGDGSIPDADYVKNMTLIGETMSGEIKVITLYNALNENGLNISMAPKDESVVELQLAAHYDPVDQSSPIYKIEQIEAPGTYTVTFTVDDGTTPLENAEVIFFGTSKLTNVSGVAVFSNVAAGLNRPYEVRKSGYETFFGSVDIIDVDVDVGVSLTLIV